MVNAQKSSAEQGREMSHTTYDGRASDQQLGTLLYEVHIKIRRNPDLACPVQQPPASVQGAGLQGWRCSCPFSTI